MDLNIVWFILITVLFSGFFLLEGFDYGVGHLAPFITDDAKERRLLLHTIAPVWDGNEVWMITAGGALFAAFPHVYATLFSAFYLPLFLLLMALILRGAGIELRNRSAFPEWHNFWDWAVSFGSALPAFLWGVTVTNLCAGLEINANMIYIGKMLDLLSGYTLVGGLTFLAVFSFHGAAFLLLRLSHSPLEERVSRMGRRVGLVAIAAFAIYLGLTAVHTDIFSMTVAPLLLIAAAVVFIVGYGFFFKGRPVPAFALTSAAIVLTTVGVFTALFPNLMISNMNPAYSLTIYNAASSPYTLTVMTIAAACLVPVVLIYQGWTYWVFRKRVTLHDMEH